jgi:peptide methionine sulfoxide reductase MsrA
MAKKNNFFITECSSLPTSGYQIKKFDEKMHKEKLLKTAGFSGKQLSKNASESDLIKNHAFKLRKDRIDTKRKNAEKQIAANKEHQTYLSKLKNLKE